MVRLTVRYILWNISLESRKESLVWPPYCESFAKCHRGAVLCVPLVGVQLLRPRMAVAGIGQLDLASRSCLFSGLENAV